MTDQKFDVGTGGKSDKTVGVALRLDCDPDRSLFSDIFCWPPDCVNVFCVSRSFWIFSFTWM